MSKNGKPSPETEFVLSDKCAWRGCGKAVASDRFVCDKHESKVPLLLKCVVAAALTARQHGSLTVSGASDDILIAVGEYLLIQQAVHG